MSNPVNGSAVTQQVPDQCCVMKSEGDKDVPKDWDKCNSDAAMGRLDSEFLYTAVSMESHLHEMRYGKSH